MVGANLSRKALLYFTLSGLLLYAAISVSFKMSYFREWSDTPSQLQPASLVTSSTLRPNHTVLTCKHAITSVAFIKVHKAGSTTVMNILQRYAWQNDLLVALPMNSHIIKQDFNNIIPLPKGRTYFDMLFNHVHHYSRSEFGKFVPPGAKYIGVAREPLSLSISAFEYYRQVFHVRLYTKIPGPDKLTEYLRFRRKYDPRPGIHSFTNNRMAFDYGLPLGKFRDKTFIESYLKKLDSEFDLIIVLEHFAESIVLLKRLMCWSLKDVLFITRNVHRKRNNVTEFTAHELAYHRHFSMADNMFYNHFLKQLKQKLDEVASDFWDEVEIYKDMLAKTKSHCQIVTRKNIARQGGDSLVFPATPFNEQFAVTRGDCELMLLHEVKFTNKSRQKQMSLLKKRQ